MNNTMCRNIFFLLVLFLTSPLSAMKRIETERGSIDDKIEYVDVCDSELRDCAVLIKDGSHSITIPCSQFSLSRKSEYFFNEISKQRRENANADKKIIIEIDHEIIKENLAFFLFLLRLIHGTADNNKNNPQFLFAMEIENYFHFVRKIANDRDKQFYDIFFPPYIFTNLKDDQKMILFEWPNKIELAIDENYEKYILQPCEMVLKEKFPSSLQVNDNLQAFKSLQPGALKIIFGPDFKTDSENTVIYFIFKWTGNNVGKFQNKEEFTAKVLRPILNLVRPNHIEYYYLGKFVKHFLNKFDLMDVYVDWATKKLCSKGDKDDPKHRPMTDNQNKDAFAMKVEFRKVTGWKLEEKYYSQPIEYFGYEFYFFVRGEKKDEDEFLAGYVRCLTECDEKDNYLRAKVALKVKNQDGNYTELPVMEIDFDHFDRSVGARISQCSWQDIINGTAPIVIENNKIEVIITFTLI